MPILKTSIHTRSKHREPYDFKKLIGCCPNLKPYVFINQFGLQTLDFTDPLAVKILNKALLQSHYQIDWDLPEPYLCPPIPSRADYIHYVADLLGSLNNGIIPQGPKVRVLDIGVGANAIYPLIGHKEYGWNFVGSEIDQQALAISRNIVSKNHLSDHIEIRFQENKDHIFKGIIQEGERFDISICNPPFHASFEEARKVNLIKWKKLKIKTKALNFGGHKHELWYPGGEKAFIEKMILESRQVNCPIFTCYVSKESSLSYLYTCLEQVEAIHLGTFLMKQGQKTSRFIAWRF
jgi:23S rRNA (adenine1618-N6)-methyltransferase